MAAANGIAKTLRRKNADPPQGCEFERGRGSSVSEREASYERLLDLPEETEELSEEGVRALREGIEDFKAGRIFTGEEIEREFRG